MYELPEDENKVMENKTKETQRKIDEIVESFLKILNERGN